MTTYVLRLILSVLGILMYIWAIYWALKLLIGKEKEKKATGTPLGSQWYHLALPILLFSALPETIS